MNSFNYSDNIIFKTLRQIALVTQERDAFAFVILEHQVIYLLWCSSRILDLVVKLKQMSIFHKLFISSCLTDYSVIFKGSLNPHQISLPNLILDLKTELSGT